MSEMIAIHIDDRGVSAVATPGCRFLCRDGQQLVVDVNGFRVTVDPLGSLEGRDRLLPLVVNTKLYGENNA